MEAEQARAPVVSTHKLESARRRAFSSRRVGRRRWRRRRRRLLLQLLLLLLHSAHKSRWGWRRRNELVLKRTSLSGRPLPSFDDPPPAAPIDDSEASTTPSTSFDARRKDKDGRELRIHIASDRPSGAWPSLVARERALKLLGRIEAGKLALGHDARARAVGLAHAVRRANVVCARRIERQPGEKEPSTVRSARS